MDPRLSISLLILAPVLAAQEGDFAKRYKATLDWQKGAGARKWTCDKGDVWQLQSFEFRQGKELRVRIGRCTVVFGKHDTNVVWATVLAVKPGTLESSLAGDGNRVRSVFLRFNPALVGELFPKKTVKRRGNPSRIALAKRVYNAKINACWQAGNQPVIPWKKSIVLDVETVGGKRRMFNVDREKGTVKYEKFFEKRALAPLEATTKRQSLAAFDAVWKAFDLEYAMFGLKPDVDWAKSKNRHRKVAASAETTYDTGVAIGQMLAELKDLHVWVKVGADWVPGYTRDRPLNASWNAVGSIVGRLEDTKRDHFWGRTKDGIGYVNTHRLSHRGSPSAFDAVLEKLAGTWALILDLRFNGGGGEDIAQKLAGRFLDRKRVYSYNHYRGGPKHDQLGPKLARSVAPRGPWRYESPVVVLFGQRTMSSAESYALMLAQCPQVTTMGDRTAGSSANPRRLELAGDITVNVPRWLDLKPDGKPLDPNGVIPEVTVATSPKDFSRTKDPVLSAALSRLREIAEAKRMPGKR